MILIVSCSGDIHANMLQACLTEKGMAHFRMNIDQFPGGYGVEFSASNNVELLHSKPVFDGILIDRNNQVSVKLAEITAVWLRKTFSFYAERGEPDALSSMMTQAELDTEQTVMSALYALNCYWMSHPKYLYTSRWRGEQLQRAVRLGFKVPDSLITNQFDSAMSFVERLSNGAVERPLSLSLQAHSLISPSFEKSPELVFHSATELADSRVFSRDTKAGEILPKLLQENITSLFELRVVVVDQLVFSTILASAQSDTSLAGKPESQSHIDVYHLPETVQRSCVAFVRSYGLTYGVMKLLKTANNEYVFLENNPTGSFLDMEQAFPAFNIMNALADTLAKGRS